MKVFSGGSAMLGGWRTTGFVRGSMQEGASSRSMGRPRKRWIHTVKDCLKKRGLDVGQARRMVYGGEFMRGNGWGVARGMNP